MTVLGQLDGERRVLTRKEHALLRKRLLGGNDCGRCFLCHLYHTYLNPHWAAPAILTFHVTRGPSGEDLVKRLQFGRAISMYIEECPDPTIKDFLPILKFPLIQNIP